MTDFTFPGSSGRLVGWGEGEASSGGGTEVGRTSVKDVEGAQQGSVWEGRQQSTTPC